MQAVNTHRPDLSAADRMLHPARRLLDDYTAGRITAAELGDGLTELCSGSPDAGWETLSWLDQYHRRGVLETSRFRDLKLRIERLAVPEHATTEIRGTSDAPAVRAADVSGGPLDDDSAEAEPGDDPDSVLLFDDDSEPALGDAAAEVLVAPAPTVARRFGIGRVLRERYEILSELGRGGMGTVYRARDRNRLGLEHVSDCVAIKVLREDWVARPEALAALRHECFRAQALSHPNIVNVFDFDRDESTCFVTMELVEGELLSQVLERVRPRRLARPDALAVLEAVGSALQYAHSCGVVHADLKPGNVMIGHGGRVRVLDFGLARPVLREPSVGGEKVLRAATPAYASPDVLRGANPVVRDDVFSFACLAYELLGGTPAFPRQSVDEARRGRAAPRRPRGVRRHEWRVIRKALAPQRERRLASVEAVLDGIRPEKTTAVPPLKALVERAATARPGWLGISLRIATACVFIAAAVLLVRAFTVAPPTVRTPPPAPAPAATSPAQSVTETPIQIAPATRLAPEATSTPTAPATIEPQATASIDESPSAAATAPQAAAAATTATASPSAPVAGPARISFAADRYAVSESGSAARITLTRSGSLRGDVAVKWWTEPGDAAADQDYADLGPEVEHFAAGQKSAVIFVPIVSDSLHEGLETFTIHIQAEGTGVEVGRDRALIAIVDDD